jgi:hypothetical protein
MDYARTDVKDEKAAKKLWEASEKLIERVEREEAVKRALLKKEKDELEKKQSSNAKPPEKPNASGNGAETKSKSRRQKKAK